MTLDSDSPFRLICMQITAKMSFALVTATLCLPALVNGHAVNSANEYSDRLFADTACLFIEEEIPPLNLLSDSTPGETGEIELNVFPMESSLQQIAQKLVEGIVGCIQSTGEDFGFADSMVNLEVLVRNQIENSTIDKDPYWNYYSSCDKWDVVFNSEPDFTRAEKIKPVDSDHELQGEAELQHIITRLKQFYLDIEFALIERDKTRQFANPFKLPIVNAIKVFAPTVELLNIRQTGALGLLSNLSDRIESAGRLVFGLKYASEICGDHFESSLPLLQH